MQKPSISVSASPGQSQALSSTFGSSASFEGYRAANQANSEPTTPFSFGSTPPLVLSRASTQRSSAAHSVSTSPEQRILAPSAASSFAASVWSRPFNLQASPPQRSRLSGDENMAMSTTSSGGVTWGPTTIHGSSSTIRRSFLAQELADQENDGSSTEEDEPVTPDARVKVNLRNQSFFDDEAHASVPLLNPEDASKFAYYRRAYANMLDVWGLNIQQNEILKFNDQPTNASAHKLSDASSQTTLMLGKSQQANTDTGSEQSVSVLRCCSVCGHVENTARPNARCAACKSVPRLMSCAICYQPVSTLYKSCLDCGHAAHMSCLRLLLESIDEEDLDCETGCGCECIKRSSDSGNIGR